MRRLGMSILVLILAGCGAAKSSEPDVNAEATELTVAVNPVKPGEYLCTVAEKTSISQTHLEDSPPPAAVIDSSLPTRFPIAISVEGDGDYRLVELPYSGSDRDPYEWHSEMSVIHGEYRGNGESFRSTVTGEEAFFVIGRTVHANRDGDLVFYHSGFEWAGGEDLSLSSRWGRCSKR